MLTCCWCSPSELRVLLLSQVLLHPHVLSLFSTSLVGTYLTRLTPPPPPLAAMELKKGDFLRLGRS